MSFFPLKVEPKKNIKDKRMNLIVDLYKKELIQFGKFQLKSGQLSSIYVDLRLLITYRDIRKNVILALCEAIMGADIEFDYVIGVPYGALLLADAVAESLKKQTIMKRKEVKTYGKKEMFLGAFEPGKRVIVIEDVVTSGSSVMETVEELKKVGLVCVSVFCVVDRNQGGTELLKREGLELNSLIQMDSILDFLVEVNKIDAAKKTEILTQMANPEFEVLLATDIPQVNWSLQSRMESFPTGSLNRRMAELMLRKRSNLCLAVDNCSKERILQIAESVGPSICALKVHCDTVDAWDGEFAQNLRKMADAKDFLLFEDRKLADTGNTMLLQLTSGFRIAEWADVVTVYPQPGAKSIEALKPLIDSPEHRLSGFLMLSELSTEGAKTRSEDGVEVAKEVGPGLISGFICQKRCHSDPKFLYWTPGVNMATSTDGKGQRWRGPVQAVVEDGCDIVIVGRGITEAKDTGAEARRYAEEAWEALSKR